MQRISAAEELSESLRVWEAHYREAMEDGQIDELEDACLRQEFAHAKHQARIVVAAQTLGIRIMRTAHFDKNLRTEIEAIERAGQEMGRLLEFPTAAQRRRRASGDNGPDAA